MVAKAAGLSELAIEEILDIRRTRQSTLLPYHAMLDRKFMCMYTLFKESRQELLIKQLIIAQALGPMQPNPISLNEEVLRNIEMNCTHYNLRKASRSVTQFFNAVLKPSGLEINQVTLLTAISLHGPARITMLAQELVMDRTTLTRDLKPLERCGFISIQSGQDKRMRFVSITKAGETALAEAVPLWESAQLAMIESLGSERWTSLLIELEHVVSSV